MVRKQFILINLIRKYCHHSRKIINSLNYTPHSPHIATKDDDRPVSEEEGEDLEEHWLDDYVPQPELDRYDEEDLDNEEYGQAKLLYYPVYSRLTPLFPHILSIPA